MQSEAKPFLKMNPEKFDLMPINAKLILIP